MIHAKAPKTENWDFFISVSRRVNNAMKDLWKEKKDLF